MTFSGAIQINVPCRAFIIIVITVNGTFRHSGEGVGFLKLGYLNLFYSHFPLKTACPDGTVLFFLFSKLNSVINQN